MRRYNQGDDFCQSPDVQSALLNILMAGGGAVTCAHAAARQSDDSIVEASHVMSTLAPDERG